VSATYLRATMSQGAPLQKYWLSISMHSVKPYTAGVAVGAGGRQKGGGEAHSNKRWGLLGWYHAKWHAQQLSDIECIGTVPQQRYVMQQTVLGWRQAHEVLLPCR
jgi:hypothetical protein